MIWFTSDWHLGHQGILLHQPDRKFNTTEEMDARIIDACNEVVKPRDTLYHLGDFCWRVSQAAHYRCRIRAKIINICRGNHDAASLGKQVTTFEHMLFAKFRFDDEIKKFHLCHYPLLSWDAKEHGGYHLYGHCHSTFEDRLNKLFPERRAMDVGIDNIYKLLGEWQPISLDEVLERSK